MSLRPRQYADYILSLPTLQERRLALLQVPEEWRELVRKHGAIAWEKQQFKRQREHANNG